MHASSVLIEALKIISLAPAFFVDLSADVTCKHKIFIKGFA